MYRVSKLTWEFSDIFRIFKIAGDIAKFYTNFILFNKSKMS